MQSKLLITIGAAVLLMGCLPQIRMADPAVSTQAKQFKAPPRGKAGVYVYRNGIMDGRTDLWLDGKCLGMLQTGAFFYAEVEGGQTHRIATQSDFVSDHVDVKAEAGKLYFVRQYLRPSIGTRVGASLYLPEESAGKTDVRLLEMAITGRCDQTLNAEPSAPAAAPAATTPETTPTQAPAPTNTTTKSKRSKQTQ